eukprot:scaffold30763_cov76-Phaeocystis_antarctica.AAC.1
MDPETRCASHSGRVSDRRPHSRHPTRHNPAPSPSGHPLLSGPPAYRYTRYSRVPPPASSPGRPFFYF